MTPLASAASRGNHRIVARLLEAGAEVNWRDEEGISAMDFALARSRNPTMDGMSSVPLDDAADFGETLKILRLCGGRAYYANDY